MDIVLAGPLDYNNKIKAGAPVRPLAGRLPPLPMLRAFEATGRTGSMRRAAADIGISHTVISRHIRNLEAWIGWKLIKSGPRGATLTVEGEALFAVTTNALQSISEIAGQLRSSAGVDELHIWSVPGLATRWLTPRLRDIQDAISSSEVLLRSSAQIPDFSLGEADVMIGFGNHDQLPDHAIPLIQPRMFPAASPSWLQLNGIPKAIEELTQLPLIHEESYAQWAHWFRLANIDVKKPLRGPRLWDANLGLDAAIAGQGVALTSNVLAANEIKNGRLIELFQTDIRVGGYFLLTSRPNSEDSRIERFREWLEAALRAFEKTS